MRLTVIIGLIIAGYGIYVIMGALESASLGMMIFGGTVTVIGLMITGIKYTATDKEYPSSSNVSSLLNWKKANGYRWTYFKNIINNKDGVYLNTAVVAIELEADPKLKRAIRPHSKKTKDIKIDALDFTKTVLLVGAPGSGKTFTMESWLDNIKKTNFKNFKRVVFHDVKGGTYSKFGEKKDIVVSLYDNRATSWNMWQEMQTYPGIVEEFMKSLVNNGVGGGDDGDFFKNSAAMQLVEMVENTFYDNPELSDSDKYLGLIKKIEDFKKDKDANDDVKATLSLALESVELMAYRFIKDPKNSFTIKEFYDSSGKVLWLLNNPTFAKKQNSYFSAITSALTTIKLGMPDTKTDLTMYVIDEILQFDISSISAALTTIRSKGGAMILGTQYMPIDNQKTKQLLDNSRFATMIFSVDDNATVKWAVDTFGKTSYESTSSKVGIDKDTTVSSKDTNFLEEKTIRSIPQFHCVSFVKTATKKDGYLLYIGKTISKMSDKKLNDESELFDLTDFKREFKSGKVLKNIVAKSNKKEITLIEKKEQFDTINNCKEDGKILELLKKYDIVDVDLDVYFKEVNDMYK
ncbi:MAG: type IV secretion system DNA-binding domain-containing protein [Campylobacterota bacterium]|nr:type IV secretion system DNA-binding domain-containing protein [Campylobacterota bacterium]